MSCMWFSVQHLITLASRTSQEALHAQQLVFDGQERKAPRDEKSGLPPPIDFWAEPDRAVAFLNEISNQNTCRIGGAHLGSVLAKRVQHWDFASAGEQLTLDGVKALYHLLPNNSSLASLRLSSSTKRGATASIELRLFSVTGSRAPFHYAGEFPSPPQGESTSSVHSICYVGHLGEAGVAHLVSGHLDGTVRLWRLDSGLAALTMKGHSGDVLSVCAVEEGRVASSSADKMVRVWNLESGVCEHVLRGHSSHVRAVCDAEGEITKGSSVFGTCVASGSSDKDVRVWELRSGSSTHVLTGHTSQVSSVCAVAGCRVASASFDKTVRVWSLGARGGSCEHVLCGHTQRVNSVCVLWNKHFNQLGVLVSASDDKTLRVWALDSGTQQRVVRTKKPVLRVAAAGGFRAISSDDSGTMRLWALSNRDDDDGEGCEHLLGGLTDYESFPPSYFLLTGTLARRTE